MPKTIPPEIQRYLDKHDYKLVKISDKVKTSVDLLREDRKFLTDNGYNLSKLIGEVIIYIKNNHSKLKDVLEGFFRIKKKEAIS